MKIFLTGRPGSGKSTVLQKTIDKLEKEGFTVGGIVTPDIRKGRKRLGFKVIDVNTGEEGILAHVDQEEGPRISKYRVDLESFEEVALSALDFAKKSDICVIDELGPMEFKSEKFKKEVHELIRSEKPLIAVVHRKLVDKFRSEGRLFKVTKANRDRLPEKIFKLIKPEAKVN